MGDKALKLINDLKVQEVSVINLLQDIADDMGESSTVDELGELKDNLTSATVASFLKVPLSKVFARILYAMRERISNLLNSVIKGERAYEQERLKNLRELDTDESKQKIIMMLKKEGLFEDDSYSKKATAKITPIMNQIFNFPFSKVSDVRIKRLQLMFEEINETYVELVKTLKA